MRAKLAKTIDCVKQLDAESRADVSIQLAAGSKRPSASVGRPARDCARLDTITLSVNSRGAKGLVLCAGP
ncbi:hypothetical protein VCV18_007282 [Metarhizium anisopliae]